MTDVLQGPKSDSQRIADRLKGSNDMSTASTVAHHGSGPTRTITSIHHSRNQQHGAADHGGTDISGRHDDEETTQHRRRAIASSCLPASKPERQIVAHLRAAPIKLVKSVAFRKDQVDGSKAYNASQLGNAKALDVGKGGPGTGRTVLSLWKPRPMGRHQFPATLHQLKIFWTAFGPERRKG